MLSFEMGALSASPGPMAARTLGKSSSSSSPAGGGGGGGAYLCVGGVSQKERSILGVGLPSTIRLPTVRSGSTASSVVVSGTNTVGPSLGTSTSVAAAAFSVSGSAKNNILPITTDSPSTPPLTTQPQRLGPLSSCQKPPQQAPLCVLYPPRLQTCASVLSDGMRRDSGRFGSGERAAGAGAAVAAEDKDKDKADRRTLRESKYSLEGRKRGSLVSLFPDSRRASSEAGGRGSGEDG